MREREIKHLPVVRDGAVIGVISDRDIKSYSPSTATGLDIYEMNYLLAKATVKDAMGRELVTTTADTAPAVAVAVNCAAGRPATVALTRWMPAVVPRVQRAPAVPLSSVVPLAGVTAPEPEAVLQVTVVPTLGPALESVTRTVSVTGSSVPTTAVCASPETTWMTEGPLGWSPPSPPPPPQAASMTATTPESAIRSNVCRMGIPPRYDPARQARPTVPSARAGC
jgi:hypothetical protein